MSVSMKELVRLPYVGTCSQHSLSREPFDQLEPALLAKVHERIVRAASFVARDFCDDDTVIPLYGWQTCEKYQQEEQVFWSSWFFGCESPKENKLWYMALSAALALEDWTRPAMHRKKERNCPLIVADLGPTTIGKITRISKGDLKQLAVNWSMRAPTLPDKQRTTRLEAFFCEWAGRAYMLTVPLFLHDIEYKSVVEIAEETIAEICGIRVQTANDHITLWHIGNFQDIDYVSEDA